MNRTEAEQYIKDSLAGYLSARGINTKKPFLCLNPAHDDHTPSMSFDPKRNKVHCFSCGVDYSTVDLIGIEYGLTDTKKIYEKAFEVFGLNPGVTLTDYRSAGKPQDMTARRAAGNGRRVPLSVEKFDALRPAAAGSAQDPETTFSFKGPVMAAHEALLNNAAAQAHFTKRGLNLDTLKRFKIGFCDGGYNAMLADYPTQQSRAYKQGLYKYIFPYQDENGDFVYFHSEISDRAQIDDYNGKYKKITGARCPIFNERYLKKDVPEILFLCEGIFDALSVEQAGGRALAFMGTGQERFLNLCKEYRPKATFVLMLDRDDAGQRATGKIKAGLTALNIPFMEYKQPETIAAKDPSEFLQTQPEKFNRVIGHILKTVAGRAAQKEAAAPQDQTGSAQDQTPAAQAPATIFKSSLDFMPEFKSIVNDSAQAEAIPTGFKNFDALLDGGLYPGLYIIGAVSSLGKTTFCLQIADNIAAYGRPVLFFSLEMARAELQAKSISRETFIFTGHKAEESKTTRGIMNGKKYKDYNGREMAAITAAVERYKKYAGNVYIYEGRAPSGERIGAHTIRQITEDFQKATGKTPVIFVDYLQILAPDIVGASDKQNTDSAVFELKEISRDLKTPVFVISSFNRDNYTSPVNMASFKESGAVEYSSDVLIGLQPAGMDLYPGENANSASRSKRILTMNKENEARSRAFKEISVQLKVLKNRNGAKGYTGFLFTSAFNFYEPLDETTLAALINGPAAGADFAPVTDGYNPFEDDAENDGAEQVALTL